MKKNNTKGYLPRVNPEYFSNALIWEYHGIPMEYPRIPGYSRYPTNTIEYLAKIVEYY